MFKGKTVRLRRIDRNRYELRTGYSLEYGTVSEIAASLGVKSSEVRLSALELAACRQSLREMVAKEDQDYLAALEPRPSLPPSPPPLPSPPVVASAPVPAAAGAQPRPRRLKDAPTSKNVEPRKRSRGGLSYLRALQAEEARALDAAQ